MEALGEVDTELTQQRQGVAVLHAFGNGLAAESLGEIDDGFDNMLVGGTVHEPSYELNVDLQIFDIEFLHVRERSESRSEIIERDTATESHNPVGEGVTCFEIPHDRSLGDLENKVGRVSPTSPNLIVDEGQHVRIHQRFGG